jgi:hypothetical protein
MGQGYDVWETDGVIIIVIISSSIIIIFSSSGVIIFIIIKSSSSAAAAATAAAAAELLGQLAIAIRYKRFSRIERTYNLSKHVTWHPHKQTTPTPANLAQGE